MGAVNCHEQHFVVIFDTPLSQSPFNLRLKGARLLFPSLPISSAATRRVMLRGDLIFLSNDRPRHEAGIHPGKAAPAHCYPGTPTCSFRVSRPTPFRVFYV